MATTGGTGSGGAVKSAMRTLDIIEYVVAHPTGVVAQEIAIDSRFQARGSFYLCRNRGNTL